MNQDQRQDPGNGAFSQKLPALQVVWDATSLTLLKTCPFKYYLSIIRGYVPKGKQLHVQFGIAYHAGLEEYDRQRASGADHEAATREAIRTALVSARGLPPDNNKNPRTLVRTIVWYLEHFKDDGLETVQLESGPAVELHFQFTTPYRTSDGEAYELCGHLDRLVQMGDEELILDRKTTKSSLGSYYFARYTPDNQMTLYTLAGKVCFKRPVRGVLIDAAQIAVGFSRFGRLPAHRTDDQIDEWFSDLQYWLVLAEGCAKANNWPMNDTACHHYGGCDFKDICSKSPAVRKQFLDSNFETRVWDPTIPRS